ncbi:MAG: methyltransferase family protein [Candidatus Thorarchaeota archaeon]
MSEESESPTLFGKKKVRVVGLREDWAMIPLAVFFLLGLIFLVLDFAYIQGLVFQPIYVIIGVPLFVIGAAYRTLALWSLNKAVIGDVISIKILQIVEGHRLLTDGYYKHIRHPSYLGAIVLVFGMGITFTGLYGLAVMTIGLPFLHFRIETEEKMLIEAFGEEYRECQKRTNKLIPFLY